MEIRTVSVVINTLNRAASLRELLVALRHQTHPTFEVVVVAGPCTDGTESVLIEFEDRIIARHCTEPNLSMSRNIGIAASSGDVMAFIDDDAIPEPGWLVELMALYDTDEVAGAGGFVFDHTGYGYQSQFILADRVGQAEFADDAPFDDLCFPGTMSYPTLLGCNSSYRRDRLVEVGGFDEEFEYYLDETDVCLRLIDHGYVIRQGRGAEVHHKFLPSSVRDSGKVVLNNTPVVKNNLYFSLVNARGYLPLEEIFKANLVFSDKRRADLLYNLGEGRVTDDEYVEAIDRIDAAWEPGVAAGMRGRVKLYDSRLEQAHRGEFLPFGTIDRAGPMLRIVLVTQTLPPAATGGIGRYCLDLGEELARRGHDVRIVTHGDGHNTVDFERGVWIHRMVNALDTPIPDGIPLVPPAIWNKASAVAREVVRLNQIEPIDVVYAPMWDVEGLGVLVSCSALTLTALMTTMGITLRTRSDWRDDQAFMGAIGQPLVDLERWVAGHSDGLHAISDAIVGEVEAAGAVALDRDGLMVSHLGVVDRGPAPAAEPDRRSVEVLFVGRLEHRKGIDLLLSAIPLVAAVHPSARFTIVGRDVAAAEGRPGVVADFEARNGSAAWFDRVSFAGEVGEDDLWEHYRRCDVFVAPSRFESFGLIFVEAMMAGRPVVAVRCGAAPEVIDDGVTGVLVDPEDVAGLADALGLLVSGSELRSSMGAAGRARFVAMFTAERMGDELERLLRECRTLRFGDGGVRPLGGALTVALPDGSTGVALGKDPLTVQLGGLGRATVVLWFDPDSEPSGGVSLTVGNEWSIKVDRPAGGGLVRVVVPNRGSSNVEIRGDAVFAAAHVVPGNR